MPWMLGAAAVGAIGSYLAAKKAGSAGRPTANQQQIEQQLLANLKATSPTALDFLSSAKTNLGTASDYYNSLYSGNRSKTLQLLAPQLLEADKQQQAAMNSSLRVMPRGGGSAEGRLSLLDSANANRNNTILGMKSNAASALGSLGSTYGSLGSSLLGNSDSSGLGLLGAINQQRGLGFDQSRALGNAFAQFAAQIGQMNLGGSGGKSTTPPQGTKFGSTTSDQTPWANPSTGGW